MENADLLPRANIEWKDHSQKSSLLLNRNVALSGSHLTNHTLKCLNDEPLIVLLLMRQETGQAGS
jgi:hypothetical protein